jgi:cystathionine gamma-synthase
VLAPMGIEYTPVDLTDPAALAPVWRSTTRLVWVETPSNPMLGIVDIRGVSSFAAERGGICIVDNTFATPYLQRPLTFGAHAVVHSSTKYLGGHSDVVGGFVATNDDELATYLAFIQNATGAVPSPLDCYLTQRGLKTLAVRMDRQCANASAIAEHLSSHPAVARVLYPGLESHEGHALATRQMKDYGAMVSFTLAGGEAAALETAAKMRVFTLAESLGAVESLVEHPARMTHASVAGSELSVDPALLRLSVGLETLDDLLWDLDRALG